MQTSHSQSYSFFKIYKGYIMWLLASSFYIYQFVLRVAPSVMLDDLMKDFLTDASGVGMLSSLALYAYAAFQIPSGFLADWWGARKIILFSCFLCIFGTFLFISSQEIFAAQIGRFLIGAGSAAAFLSVSKIVTQWFPIEKRSFLFGMTMTAGTIGALNGGAPLSLLTSFLGWKKSLGIVTLFGCLIFSLIYFFLKEKKEQLLQNAHEKLKTTHLQNSGHLLTQFFKDPTSWIYAVSAFGIYLPISVIADLWGTAFMMKAYSIPRHSASQAVSCMYIGLCIGSLVVTWISDKINKKRVIIQFSAILLTLFTFVFIQTAGYSILLTSFLLLCIGMLCGTEMVCFAGITEIKSSQIGGTVVGFINGVVMLGGAIIQHLIGHLLDYNWTGDLLPSGLKSYSFQNYQNSLYVVVCMIAFASIFTLMIPKKNK